MTIEAKATVPYESYWVGQERGQRRGELIYRRVLLRPHGSGGRVQPYPYLGHIFWTIGGPVSGAAFFDTRAQAAREAYRE